MLDLEKQVVEKSESAFLSAVKRKPFQKREKLSVDIDAFRRMINELRKEYMVNRSLEQTSGLLKNDNPIKTQDVKRAFRQREDSTTQ